MRKVLLFLTLFLTAATGVKAEPVEWSDGNGNSIKYDIHNDNVVIEVGNTGALAAFFAATDNDTKAMQDALKAATPTKFKVKGGGGPDADAVELSAFDIAALNNLTQVTELDLSEKATVALPNMNGLAMSSLQYLILPNGSSGEDMWNTIGRDISTTNNPNLKMAASVTNATETGLPTWNNAGQQSATASVTGTINTKKLALYSWQANSVDGFKSGHAALFNDIDKLDLAGAYGDQDLVKNNKNVFTSNKLHYFDFTGATFAQMGTAQSYTTGYTYMYDMTWNSNSQQMTGGERKTETTYNSFNYFHNYISSAYTLTFPTGNTDVPAGLFKGYNWWNCGLLEVTIPEGYTRIGAEAFYDTSIQSIVLPASMEFVSYGAFLNSKIVNVEMKASNTSCTFEDQAFKFCKSLKHFTMSEGVTSIPDMMFEQCANLEFIRIPSTCATIGYLAFNLCLNLHSVTIPVGVQEIKPQAFRLAALTDVYLLATQASELPLITPQSSINDSDQGTGTFNGHQLWANKTAAKNAASRIPNSTSEEVLTFYQEELSGNYLGSNNCITALHFPKSLGAFLDAYDLDDPSQGTISSRYAYTDMDEKKWPSGGANNSDYYKYRVTPDGVSVTDLTPTVNAWRQFAIVNGDVVNYSKVYDETWYTMCFPWHVTDTQLFEAFNQACEIVEFRGVELIADDNEVNAYNLVLHFDNVAQTHYIDNDNVEYNREFVEAWSHTEQGITIVTNLYKYTSKEDGTEVTFTKNASDASVNALYFQIQNIMAIAGHPYMIHPAAVEKYDSQTGSRVGTLCTIADVKRIATTDEELENLEEAGRVTRTATTGDAQTAFVSPLGGTGSYTFKGYLGRGIEDAGYDETADASDIPLNAYFLAAPTGQKYPKYYRQKAEGTDNWTLYTAIIEPDADALANIEALDGAKVNGSANVAFGDWEQVEATAIEEIIAEAQQRGEEVREVNLNVVYNINGQVVRTDGQIEGLPKGLYIVNGKKYMVK